MTFSDEELVKKCLNGEDSAYGFLVDKYKGAVHALARKKLSNYHEAEDLAQEVFLKAYRNLPSLKDPNRFAGWLYVITANECHHRLRKRSREEASLLAAHEKLHEYPESRYFLEQEQQQLHDAIDALPESDQTVIHLHYFGGLTCEEISRFMGTSKDAVKMRLSRARTHLREEITAMFEHKAGALQLPMQFTVSLMERIHRMPFLPSRTSQPLPWARFAPIGALMLVALIMGLGWFPQQTIIPPFSWEETQEIALPTDLLDWPLIGESLSIGEAIDGGVQESGMTLQESNTPEPPRESSAAKLAALLAVNSDKVDASGTVLINGKPVSRARVVAVDNDTKVAETITEADGKFAFEDLPSLRGRWYSLIAHAPDYAIGWHSQSILKQDLRNVEISLKTGTEHQGTVKDAQGIPIKGAQVQVVFLMLDDGGIHLSQEIGYGFTQTDANGKYTIPNLPKGSSIHVEVDHPDYALERTRPIPVEDRPTILLSPGGSIRGRAYFAETLKSPGVVAVLASANVREHNVPPPRQEVHTDEEGNFVFAHIQAGSYYLVLSQRVPGWTYVAPAVRVEEGKQVSNADFVLIKGAMIEGTVLDQESSEPIANAEVRMWDTSQPYYSEATEPIRVKTNEHGFYQMQVAPGTVRLSLDPPKGYRLSKDETLSLQEGDEIRMDLKLIRVGLVTIHGQVRANNSAPVPNAMILVTPINAITKSDGNGEFLLEEVTEGMALYLQAFLLEAGLKGGLPILSGKDTDVTITLTPVGDNSARSSVLAQDILAAARKYREILLRRKRWSQGDRRADEPTGQEESQQYRAANFQLTELLSDYYGMTGDKAAYLPNGWIHELTRGMFRFSFTPGPGAADIIHLGPSDDILRE